MGNVLKAENLIRNYKLPNKEEDTIKVLKGLNFEIRENEFVGIMGKSGCGKTTLLKLLGLIDRPTEGKLYFKERQVEELWRDELADIRRRELGFVFQDFYLMDSLTVEENIMIPLILDKAEEEKCFKGAREHAEHFQITHLLKKYPYDLSGGERQRVAICRALINQPELILADEPTGSLDSKSGKVVIEALSRINQEYKKTIVMVTHDPQVASYCSRIIFLKDGRILDILERKEGKEAFYQEILGRMAEL